MNPVFNICHYKKDGFEKVCDVYINRLDGGWAYKNINHDLMYSNHRSWIYFIVADKEIVKAGETGNPLGIQEAWIYGNQESQPRTGSISRLGRYRKGDGTDSYIRESLKNDLRAGKTVSFWAKKCPVKTIQERIGDQVIDIKHTFHKDLEQAYLQHFRDQAGRLPRLNKASK